MNLTSKIIKKYLLLLINAILYNIPIYFVLILFSWIMLKNVPQTLIFAVFLMIFSWIHEIGHMICLDIFRITYIAKAKFLKLTTYAVIREVENLNIFKRILITIAGSVFSITFSILFILINQESIFLTFCGYLLIFIELLNLIYGQDGKILAETIKNHKKNGGNDYVKYN